MIPIAHVPMLRRPLMLGALLMALAYQPLQAHGAAGDSCATSDCTFTTSCGDPDDQGNVHCVTTEDCSAVCGAGNTCTSDGVCAGPVCGSGNTVCDVGTVCDYAADCVPACLGADDQPMYDTPDPGTSCTSEGELAAADGRCFVPANYRLCKLLGGHGPPLSALVLRSSSAQLVSFRNQSAGVIAYVDQDGALHLGEEAQRTLLDAIDLAYLVASAEMHRR